MSEPQSLPFQPQRVLAIGAHPDDVEYFAGATVAALRAAGASVSLLVCTDGSRGGRNLDDPAAVRRAEQERAAAALGVDEWIWLAHPDGSLQPGDPLREDLVRNVRRARPELVLAHDPRTVWTLVGGIAQPGHSDHRAAGQATLDAIYPRSPSPNFHPDQLRGAGALKLWYPREVWLFDTAQPDLRVDARDHFARKEASLLAHASQEEAVGGLVAAARALGAHWGSANGPAEAFVRLRLY
jgi:LmbE family N-acetylglucosaminyl deacetylase